MIEIINNQGHILELDDDTSITVERNNSLFNETDSFIQDVSYSAKAGITPSNKIFINGGHRVASDNEVYELPVRVIVSGEPFYAGIFSYKIIQDKIQFTLKINFGSVANLIKTAKINEIISADGPEPVTTEPGYANYMKDTCLNPQNYPYVFFPVKNLGWPVDNTPQTPYLIMNWWDSDAQNFFVESHFGSDYTLQVPFYRLSYILKIVFKSLGFSTDGGYFEEDDSKNLYLYTRRGMWDLRQRPSTHFLPAITIGEFLKQVARRLNISFDFDLFSKKVYIESFVSILAQNEYNDISNYITNIKEIGTVTKKGYTVLLKPDESDDQFSNNGDPKSFFPTNILTVGSGEAPTELEISTLKEENSNLGYYFPVSTQRQYYYSADDIPTWQLRLLRYEGMKDLPSGKVYPEARSVELSPKDAQWYRFLNDSKRVIVEAAIPPSVLSRMKPSKKIILKDKQGALFYALPEKISYNLSNQKKNLINVVIQARTIVNRYTSTFRIEAPIDPQDDNDNMRYKAYFDPKIHGISELEITFVDPTSAGIFEAMKVKSPTDINGMGGDIGQIIQTSGDPFSIFNAEIRIHNLSPRYAIIGGRRIDFLPGPGYYYVKPASLVNLDTNPFWIVF